LNQAAEDAVRGVERGVGLPKCQKLRPPAMHQASTEVCDYLHFHENVVWGVHGLKGVIKSRLTPHPPLNEGYQLLARYTTNGIQAVIHAIDMMR
jgi:hypothetical protein